MAEKSSTPANARGSDDACPEGVPLRNLDESPLAWLARRRDKGGQPMISASQFNAGEQLRADFTRSQLSPRITSNWSGFLSGGGGERRGPSGHGVDIADHVVAARQRINQAMAAVGPELAGILLDVCCYLRRLETLEKAAGWPQRSGKIVLQIALQRLARHYGLVRDDEPPRSSLVRHWGAAGYRPD